MDTLTQIISTFSKPDATDFASFINRLKKKQKRKDLELFQLIYRNGHQRSEDLVKKIYPDGNQEAYHALRKKLLKHLTDFLYMKQVKRDDTEETQVAAYMSLARYLKAHDCLKPAWRFLQKAEQKALDGELYSMANAVMGLQLEMPLKELGESIDPVLERKERYKQFAIEDDNANTAYHIIQYKLQEAKTSVEVIDLHSIIENVLQAYQLSSAVIRRPSVLYKLMSMTRSAVMAEKDYFAFEPLVIQYYESMESSVGFEGRDLIYKARLQYMIAHTLYRNKKFKSALTYLQYLRDSFKRLNRVEYARLLPRFSLLYCAIRFFTNHMAEAIRIADAAFMEKLKMKPEYVLNLRLNQAIYHFFHKDFKEANNVLQSIGHTNSWCARTAGVEWVFKKDLLEVLIQFELTNFDIATNRIRALLRQDELLKSHPKFERAKTFVALVKEVVDNPDVPTLSNFHEKVEATFDWIPIEQEDLHASVFYAWLKAKMLNRDPYEVLLDLITVYDE